LPIAPQPIKPANMVIKPLDLFDDGRIGG
jgi:hypothetical protein